MLMKSKGGKTLKIFSAFVIAAGDLTLGFVDVGRVLYHGVTATAEHLCKESNYHGTLPMRNDFQ